MMNSEERRHSLQLPPFHTTNQSTEFIQIQAAAWDPSYKFIRLYLHNLQCSHMLRYERILKKSLKGGCFLLIERNYGISATTL